MFLIKKALQILRGFPYYYGSINKFDLILKLLKIESYIILGQD